MPAASPPSERMAMTSLAERRKPCGGHLRQCHSWAVPFVPGTWLACRRLVMLVRYVPPEEFDELQTIAKSKGFKKVVSGPFVRSSYHARDIAETN